MEQKTHLEPLYLSPAFVNAIKMAEPLWRYDVAGSRIYRRKNGESFRSLTTFLSAVESPKKNLETWREMMVEDLRSGDKVDEFITATADFGTCLHEGIAHIVRENQVDWVQYQGWVKRTLEADKFEGQTLNTAVRTLVNNTAAILQFFHEYNVTILAVELPCWSTNGIATLVDLVVTVDSKKYEKTIPEKRVRHNAIINLKSGKNSSFDSFGLQLIGERMMFNEIYGKSFGEINAIYNLSPVAWRTQPSYKLTNWTNRVTEDDNRLVKLFNNCVERAHINGFLGEPKMTFTTFKGITRLGASPIDQLFVMGYKEYVDDEKNFTE